MIITQTRIIESLISEALCKEDHPVLNTFQGTHMVGVASPGGTGLSSVIPGLSCAGPVQENYTTLHSMIFNLKQQETIHASWGLAAVNSLLNPGSSGLRIKAQDLIRDLGRGRNIAVIGHFPFVEKMGAEFDNLWVLEKLPGDKDLHEEMKATVLPRAHLVAMTATTLLNGTLAEIMNLISDKTIKIMLGPSTPMAETMFNLGFDYLGGAVINDPLKTSLGIEQGLPFRHLQGVDFIVQEKSP